MNYILKLYIGTTNSPCARSVIAYRRSNSEPCSALSVQRSIGEDRIDLSGLVCQIFGAGAQGQRPFMECRSAESLSDRFHHVAAIAQCVRIRALTGQPEHGDQAVGDGIHI